VLCPGTESQIDVTDAITRKAAVELDESTLVTDSHTVGVDLAGTVNGEPVSAGSVDAFKLTDRWSPPTAQSADTNE
jgi:hypothetical protein